MTTPELVRDVTDVDAWVILEKGAIIEGRLLGIDAMKSGRRDEFFIIELTKPCKVSQDRDEIDGVAGMRVGMGIRATLERYRHYRGYVRFTCKGKKQSKNGDFWDFDTDVEKHFRPNMQPKAAAVVQHDDSDIPF